MTVNNILGSLTLLSMALLIYFLIQAVRKRPRAKRYMLISGVLGLAA